MKTDATCEIPKLGNSLSDGGLLLLLVQRMVDFKGLENVGSLDELES